MESYNYTQNKTRNWYHKAQLSYGPKENNLIKTASLKNDDYAPADNQWASAQTMYDVQRYVMDSYSVKTALSKSDDAIHISLLCNHNFLGTLSWDAYWIYPLKEEKKARSSYNKVITAIKETMEGFIKERKPTSIFWPTIRVNVTDVIDADNRVHTNIPSVNYTKDVKYEADWRKSLYGSRYPAYKELSYEEYINKDKPRIGKFPD